MLVDQLLTSETKGKVAWGLERQLARKYDIRRIRKDRVYFNIIKILGMEQ